MSITDEIHKQFAEDLAELKRMRDELKVKLHLASMEAKDRWKTLEPKLEELEQKIVEGGSELGATTTRMFEDIGRAFREFSHNLTGKDKHEGGGDDSKA